MGLFNIRSLYDVPWPIIHIPLLRYKDMLLDISGNIGRIENCPLKFFCFSVYFKAVNEIDKHVFKTLLRIFLGVLIYRLVGLDHGAAILFFS